MAVPSTSRSPHGKQGDAVEKHTQQLRITIHEDFRGIGLLFGRWICIGTGES